MAVTSQMSMYEICAVNPFESLPNDDPFMEALRKRMRYEAYFPNIDYKTSGFPFWPSMEHTCYDSYITFMETRCSMRLPDLTATPIIRIGEESFNINHTPELFAKHQLSVHTETFIRKVYNPALPLTFPEVPSIVIFANSIRTPFYHEFGKDLDELIAKGQFPHAQKIGYVFGDKTVPSYSTLLPSLRWAFYHDNPRKDDTVNHKPVKFVEFCSQHNREVPIYDTRNRSGPFKITKNAYIGLECECNEQRKGDDYGQCEHANIHADEYVIEFLLKVLDANVVASSEAIAEINALNEDDLEADLKECASIRSGIFV
jgi:hypothetical protein